MVFWGVLGAGAAVSLSGLLLLFPFYVTNIAGMQIARQKRGGTALSILTVDSRVDDAVLAKVASEIDASVMKAIEVVEL
mgnify:CR=1 FL=1